MRSLLILLMVGLPVFAQVMLPARRVVAPATATAVDPNTWLPNGIVLRWVASDLSSSPVETWTDRIQGFNLKQTTEATKPLWSTNGVEFVTSDILVATNMGNAYAPDGPNSCAWLFILNFNNPAGANEFLIGNNLSGGDFFIYKNVNFIGEGTGSADEIGPISSNVFDLFITRTNYLDAHCYATTNGIKALDRAAAWVYGSTVTKVGGAGSFFYNGTLREMICWTNLVCTEMMLSNVHKYATSVYPILF